MEGITSFTVRPKTKPRERNPEIGSLNMRTSPRLKRVYPASMLPSRATKATYSPVLALSGRAIWATDAGPMPRTRVSLHRQRTTDSMTERRREASRPPPLPRIRRTATSRIHGDPRHPVGNVAGRVGSSPFLYYNRNYSSPETTPCVLPYTERFERQPSFGQAQIVMLWYCSRNSTGQEPA